jgi:hypothetical protein
MITFEIGPIIARTAVARYTRDWVPQLENIVQRCRALDIQSASVQDVIISFTDIAVVTFGPLRLSLMSRRNTERFCVNLTTGRKKGQDMTVLRLKMNI